MSKKFSRIPSFSDINTVKPDNRLYTNTEMLDTEQQEMDYLDYKIKPLLNKIMPEILAKKADDPVPVIIRKIHEL